MLDPLEEDLGDPAPLAAVLADPAVEVVLHAGRQDVAILRRAWRPTFANVFDTQVAAGFAGFSAQAGYTGLLHDVLQDPARQVGLVHALGRAAADARAAALRARGRRAPAAARRRAAAAADRARAAGVGARGVPWRSRRRPTSASPRRCGGGCRASPASTRASARWRASWRPGGSARRRREDRPVGSVVRDPTLVELAKRAPRSTRAAGPDPRRGPGRHAPPRARHPRRVERGRAAPADPPRRGRAARDRRRSTGRRSRSPRRSCARARRRPGSPTS